jgi:hypothetical protein
MTEPKKVSKRCGVCGAELECGILHARNQSTVTDINEPLMAVTEFAFVRPGVPTSPNLVTAFLQGIRGESSDQALAVIAYRCTRCGWLELYAADKNWCTKGRD